MKMLVVIGFTQESKLSNSLNSLRFSLSLLVLSHYFIVISVMLSFATNVNDL